MIRCGRCDNRFEHAEGDCDGMGGAEEGSEGSAAEWADGGAVAVPL